MSTTVCRWSVSAGVSGTAGAPSGPPASVPKPAICSTAGTWCARSLRSSAIVVPYDGMTAPNAWSCSSVMHSDVNENFQRLSAPWRQSPRAWASARRQHAHSVVYASGAEGSTVEALMSKCADEIDGGRPSVSAIHESYTYNSRKRCRRRSVSITSRLNLPESRSAIAVSTRTLACQKRTDAGRSVIDISDQYYAC
jgi:hypothetical protein